MPREEYWARAAVLFITRPSTPQASFRLALRLLSQGLHRCSGPQVAGRAFSKREQGSQHELQSDPPCVYPHFSSVGCYRADAAKLNTQPSAAALCEQRSGWCTSGHEERPPEMGRGPEAASHQGLLFLNMPRTGQEGGQAGQTVKGGRAH